MVNTLRTKIEPGSVHLSDNSVTDNALLKLSFILKEISQEQTQLQKGRPPRSNCEMEASRD